MRPILKAGDIWNLHDARYCSAVGISMLGFNMGKERAQFLSAPQVKEILSWLSGPDAVGEFFYEKPAQIAEAVQISGIHRISIPADYRLEEAAGLPLPLIFRVETQSHLLRLGQLVNSFPSAFFEMDNEWAENMNPQEKKLVLPRTLILAQNPDPIWSFAKKDGLLPFGFTLGNFISDPEGNLDYGNCDSFLEIWEQRMPV